ncbi:DUF6214 family protein [Streptomyces lasalocidi]
MSVWPAWEVRERDGTLSWFHVRLAFPDGARVDALAVAREGRVSIEDVQAEPALSLADLTALADWLKGPLSGACGVAGDTVDAAEGRTDEGEGAGAGAGVAEGAPESVAEEGARVPEESYEAGVNTAPVEDGEADGRSEDGEDGVSGEDGGETAGLCATPRRERSAWPRGVEGCRRAAQEYRAAQEEGVDPVLAVMTATGRSRRRSLKLIAQARDAGFLTARHARRG